MAKKTKKQKEESHDLYDSYKYGYDESKEKRIDKDIALAWKMIYVGFGGLILFYIIAKIFE